jgi:hypothetical protein
VLPHAILERSVQHALARGAVGERVHCPAQQQGRTRDGKPVPGAVAPGWEASSGCTMTCVQWQYDAANRRQMGSVKRLHPFASARAPQRL